MIETTALVADPLSSGTTDGETPGPVDGVGALDGDDTAAYWLRSYSNGSVGSGGLKTRVLEFHASEI